MALLLLLLREHAPDQPLAVRQPLAREVAYPGGHLRLRRHRHRTLDGVGEVRRAGVAAVRALRRRSREHDLERRRDAFDPRADGRHVAAEHLHQQLGLGPALQRPLAREHLPEHQARGVDVGLRRDLAAHLLRREVGDLAAHTAIGRRDEPPVGLRHAKVGDLRGPVGADEHVLRRGVAVDDAEQRARLVARLVRGLQTAEHVPRDGRGDGHGHAHLPPAGVVQQARERLAVEVVHDRQHHDPVRDEVDHLDDVGMDDVPREAHLVEEPRYRGGITGEPLVQPLDGDRVRLPTPRDPQMDRSRRSRSERVVQGIASVLEQPAHVTPRLARASRPPAADSARLLCRASVGFRLGAEHVEVAAGETAGRGGAG